MTKPSLILRFHLIHQTIEIVDIHFNKVLKEIPCNDSAYFEVLDEQVRTGLVSFDFLLSDKMKSLSDLIDFCEANLLGFSVGDEVKYNQGIPFTFIIKSFDLTAKPTTVDIAAISNSNCILTVTLNSLEKIPEKAPPAPIHHKTFKDGDKVYVGLIPYIFKGMHDMNHATLKQSNGAFITCAIEHVTATLASYERKPKTQSHHSLTMSPPANNKANEEEHTGGSSSYYMVTVTHPTTLEESYQAECNDMIEALQMTPAEANIFKAVWRTAAHRQGKKDCCALALAQKIIFFGERMLVAADKELPF